MFRMIDRATMALEPVMLLVGRLCIGVLFVPGGWGKITHIAGFSQMLASRGVPAPGVLGYLGAAVEFLGGLAVALGVKTRAAALLMVAFTIVATLISHRFWEFSDAAARTAQQVNFFKNVAIIGGLLFLASRGAGPYSVDRALDRRR
jgi:putative oxidoreductase